MIRMITANQLVKTYGKNGVVRAVDGVSFSVARGAIFGLIGPDGAGKTSIFRMLTTLLLPDGGTARVDGLDVVGDYRKIRRNIGYMPGKFSLYPDLTVTENLHFFATLFHTTIAKNYELIRDIYEQLARFSDRRAGKLSGGMKQKLALCCALIHAPAVLFLDEPTTGVDPVSRKEFWGILQKLKAREITIMVSTPYMDEAVLCDRIGLMQQGRLLSADTPENIMRAYPDDLFRVKASDMYGLLKATAANDKKTSGYAFGEYAHISFKKKDMVTPAGLRDYYAGQGFPDAIVEPSPATVEDCFIKYLSD